MLNAFKEIQIDKPQIPVLRLETNLSRVKPLEMTILINSFNWGMDFVFILHVNQGFRLIAIFKRTVLCDQIFPTLTKAKEAFTNLFCNRTWTPGIESKWNLSYPPDQDWLDHKFKILAKHASCSVSVPVPRAPDLPGTKNHRR
jgi:hypothetical protein